MALAERLNNMTSSNSLVVPRIWPSAYAESYRHDLAIAQSSGQPPSSSIPVLSDAGSELVVAYAFNRPAAFETLNYGHLRELGLSLQALHELALVNLTEFVRNRITAKQFALVPPQTKPSDSGNVLLSHVEVGEDMEASCILLPWLWQSLGARVQGDLRLAVPTRGHLLFCGTSDPGILWFQTAASEIYASATAGAISARLFAVAGSQLVAA